MPWCQNGLWDYPAIGEALAKAGMEPIGKYISCRHTSVAQYIRTRQIFDFAVAAEKWPGYP